MGNKNCKMQDIAVFCNYSSSVGTDTFGLYCSVNRQDMKLGRVCVCILLQYKVWVEG